MAMAPAAYLLYAKVMRHNPRDPRLARPRPLRALRRPRLDAALLRAAPRRLRPAARRAQAASASGARARPGHPERDHVHVTPGVEVTTGPLGQGFANGVGMAMAERFLRERYGAEVVDHHVYAIVSDGDLMEGIASEAASLAGHLGLGQLVYLYDDNDISLDGPTSLSFDYRGRRQALRGLRLARARRSTTPTTSPALEAAISAGQAEDERPTLIRVKSIIGYPSPNKQGTSQGPRRAAGRGRGPRHEGGAGLGSRRAVPRPRRRLRARSTPQRGAGRAGRVAGALRGLARRRRRARRGVGPRLGRARRCPASRDALPARLAARTSSPRASRAARRWPRSRTSCRRWSAAPPTSASRRRPSSRRRGRALPRRDPAGRNVFFGVREHGMGGAVNGMAAHGGIVRPVRLDVPAVRRLHARLDPPQRADRPRRRVGLHARLGRARRGRPDPPAGRAPRRAARDPAA